MTDISTSHPGVAGHHEQALVWQWQIRVFHWSFAAAVVVLTITGLNINSPWWTSGPGSTEGSLMGWMRFLHFTAAMVFCVAFAWRVFWFWFGNRHARSGFPYVWRARWWRNLLRQLWSYLRYDFARPAVGHNALAGLSYAVFCVGCGIGEMATGLALFGESNPGGVCDRCFGWVIPLCGNSFRTHMWHHLFAWAFVLFVLLHVYIVLLDARQYRNGLIRSMVTGRKRVLRNANGEIEGDDD